MPLDLRLLEGLLHEAEGAYLDFKSAQYPFENADVGQKAELLKDILAFANSWRRMAAYILIGVEEVKGGRSKVVGVNNHLDDASLHQFVNTKTQRAVEFSYQAVPLEGTTIGVIEIPLQQRPSYLNERYHGLREHAVFIRDGSSTRVATPEEIAKMGAEEVISTTPQLEPNFRVWLVDDNGCEAESIDTEYHVFEPMAENDIQACIQSLKVEFPLATDFGSRNTSEKEGTSLVERFAAMTYIYTPASDEEITKYKEEKYPKWIKECEQTMSHLHESIQNDISQPCFIFVVVNGGSRPGNDTLVNIIAEGDFKICPPPFENDASGEDTKIDISLPPPPPTPSGRWTPKSSLLTGHTSSAFGHTSSLFGLANLFSGLGGFTPPTIDRFALHGVASNIRRDPNAFYYKPNRATTPQQSFSLECEQWRHGTNEESFGGSLFFDLDTATIAGELTCEVHAENLSSPVKKTFPVKIFIKRVTTADHARLLIQNLQKTIS